MSSRAHPGAQRFALGALAQLERVDAGEHDIAGRPDPDLGDGRGLDLGEAVALGEPLDALVRPSRVCVCRGVRDYRGVRDDGGDPGLAREIDE
jgi:hypothetical protein